MNLDPKYRNYARIGSQLFAISTVVRQLRHARAERDGLRLVDALVNAAAIITAVLLLWRELRQPAQDAEGAVEQAPL